MNFSLTHHRRVRGRGPADPGCRGGGGRGGAGGGGHPAPLPAAGHPAPLPAAAPAGPAQRPALAGGLYAETANLWVYGEKKSVSKNISSLSIKSASLQYPIPIFYDCSSSLYKLNVQRFPWFSNRGRQPGQPGVAAGGPRARHEADPRAGAAPQPGALHIYISMYISTISTPLPRPGHHGHSLTCSATSPELPGHHVLEDSLSLEIFCESWGE